MALSHPLPQFRRDRWAPIDLGTFRVPEEWDERTLIRFGAVDWRSLLSRREGIACSPRHEKITTGRPSTTSACSTSSCPKPSALGALRGSRSCHVRRSADQA